jgi:hypothetical protein
MPYGNRGGAFGVRRDIVGCPRDSFVYDSLQGKTTCCTGGAMREERSWRDYTLLWVLLAGLSVPIGLLAFGVFRPVDPARNAAEGTGGPTPAATRVLDARQVGTDAGGLTSELSVLRAAVDGERARLWSYQQTQDRLAATIGELRVELMALERRRDQLQREVAQAGTEAALTQTAQAEPEAPQVGAAPPDPGQLDGDSGATTPIAAIAGGGRGAQGDAETGLPEVVIRHRAGSTAARRAAEQVAAEVRRAGLGDVELRPTQQVPRMRTVRYFREEDAPAGEQMVSRFRSRWSHPWAMQASAAETESGRRVLEIWLPH